jgi:uncharacterized phage protein (TIGR01671 family)
MVGNGDIWIIDEGSCDNEWIVNNDLHLMQSTGFTDDVGEEIFENDIILWTYWDEFEDSGRAMIILENGIFKLIDTRTGKEVWDNLFDCIENCNVYLQGNTYENKELLEVTE